MKQFIDKFDFQNAIEFYRDQPMNENVKIPLEY